MAMLDEAVIRSWFDRVHRVADSVRNSHTTPLQSDLEQFAVEKTLNTVLGKPVDFRKRLKITGKDVV